MDTCKEEHLAAALLLDLGRQIVGTSSRVKPQRGASGLVAMCGDTCALVGSGFGGGIGGRASRSILLVHSACRLPVAPRSFFTRTMIMFHRGQRSVGAGDDNVSSGRIVCLGC